jgi:hypothetical protein
MSIMVHNLCNHIHDDYRSLDQPMDRAHCRRRCGGREIWLTIHIGPEFWGTRIQLEGQVCSSSHIWVDYTPPLLSIQFSMDGKHRSNETNFWHCVNHRGPVNPIHHAVTQVVSVGIILSFAAAPTVLFIIAVALIYRQCKRVSRC